MKKIKMSVIASRLLIKNSTEGTHFTNHERYSRDKLLRGKSKSNGM